MWVDGHTAPSLELHARWCGQDPPPSVIQVYLSELECVPPIPLGCSYLQHLSCPLTPVCPGEALTHAQPAYDCLRQSGLQPYGGIRYVGSSLDRVPGIQATRTTITDGGGVLHGAAFAPSIRVVPDLSGCALGVPGTESRVIGQFSSLKVGWPAGDRGANDRLVTGSVTGGHHAAAVGATVTHVPRHGQLLQAWARPALGTQ